jgi:hypothetical protein
VRGPSSHFHKPNNTLSAAIVAPANTAWSRVPGIPLSEADHNPITDFLEVAKSECELEGFMTIARIFSERDISGSTLLPGPIR